MRRVYVPTTLARLRAALEAGQVDPTDDVVVAEDDDEESEYAALMTAADASATLLGGSPGRRVVVVAETSGDLSAPIPVARLVAVHADVADREAGADPDEDLAWYAVQEIDSLLD